MGLGKERRVPDASRQKELQVADAALMDQWVKGDDGVFRLKLGGPDAYVLGIGKTECELRSVDPKRVRAQIRQALIEEPDEFEGVSRLFLARVKRQRWVLSYRRQRREYGRTHHSADHITEKGFWTARRLSPAAAQRWALRMIEREKRRSG